MSIRGQFEYSHAETLGSIGMTDDNPTGDPLGRQGVENP
jgi:hypothetical protein